MLEVILVSMHPNDSRYDMREMLVGRRWKIDGNRLYAVATERYGISKTVARHYMETGILMKEGFVTRPV